MRIFKNQRFGPPGPPQEEVLKHKGPKKDLGPGPAEPLQNLPAWKPLLINILTCGPWTFEYSSFLNLVFRPTVAPGSPRKVKFCLRFWSQVSFLIRFTPWKIQLARTVFIKKKLSLIARYSIRPWPGIASCKAFIGKWKFTKFNSIPQALSVWIYLAGLSPEEEVGVKDVLQ